MVMPQEKHNEVEIALKEALQFIRRAQNLLNYPIMATPTGARRGKITESNIHLGLAEQALVDLNNLNKENNYD
jgi:hypothetical protein